MRENTLTKLVSATSAASPCLSVPSASSVVSIPVLGLIILILILVGALPTWPHSSKWGYGPSGGLGFIVVILVILLLMGRIERVATTTGRRDCGVARTPHRRADPMGKSDAAPVFRKDTTAGVAIRETIA